LGGVIDQYYIPGTALAVDYFKGLEGEIKKMSSVEIRQFYRFVASAELLSHSDGVIVWKKD
jgi:hypothetical protein